MQPQISDKNINNNNDISTKMIMKILMNDTNVIEDQIVILYPCTIASLWQNDYQQYRFGIAFRVVYCCL